MDILNNDLIVFIVVSILALAECFIFMMATRDITFLAVDTDNYKQIGAASVAERWTWPSDMHKYGKGKTVMKDVFVLGIVLLQRLMQDKTTNRPVLALAAIANAVSAILIYLISLHYWGVQSAVIVSLLYMTSFWPWQITLQCGHICVGQLFFLLSVFCLQMAEATVPGQAFGLFLASGSMFILSQFSSASSRKFVVLFLGAFLYTQRGWLSLLSVDRVAWMTLVQSALWPMTILAILFLVVRLSYKGIISAIYNNKAPVYFSSLIKNREEYDLNHFLRKARAIVGVMEAASVSFYLYLMAYLVILGKVSLFFAQLPVLIGMLIASAGLLFPDVLKNLYVYFQYNYGGHFVLYRNYFTRIGKPIKDNMRGAGLVWIIKYFKLVCPVVAWLYASCGVFLLISSLSGLVGEGKIGTVLAIIVLSLSPVLWAEMTGAPQLGRSYFPGLHGQLIVIGLTLMQINLLLSAEKHGILFWFFVGVLVVANGVWNLWIFLKDVFPAAMAPAFLVRALKKSGIKKFYTYDTRFNESFVNTINEGDLKYFEICYVQKLSEIKEMDAFVVIPAVSAQGFNMAGTEEGCAGMDFREDPLLNELMDSRQIEDCALARFKTVGTSRIWIHEEEACTYKDLILNVVTEEDFWRGHGWIVSMEKVKAVLGDGWIRSQETQGHTTQVTYVM